MEHRSHNRLRQLQGLVAIDAWHTPPEADTQNADLHVYVHFDEARLGGQANDQIAFRMVLRQAEIRVSQTEPASFRFDPASMWRGDDDQTGKVKQTHSESASLGTDKGVEGKLGLASASIGVTEKSQAQKGQSSTLEFETNQPLKGISVSFYRNDRNTPAWVLKPTGFRSNPEGVSSLQGLPWSSDKQRLLRLHRRSDQSLGDSDIRIKVTCRREDLHFYDIHTRSGDGTFKPVKKDAPLRVVLEEYLKNALTAEGLPAGDMNSMFSFVILGEVVSEPRHPDDF